MYIKNQAERVFLLDRGFLPVAALTSLLACYSPLRVFLSLSRLAGSEKFKGTKLPLVVPSLCSPFSALEILAGLSAGTGWLSLSVCSSWLGALQWKQPEPSLQFKNC